MLQKTITAPQVQVSITPSQQPSERTKLLGSKEVWLYCLDVWNLDTIALFEEIKVIFLDRKNRVMGYRDLNIGTSNSCLLNMKLIFCIATQIHAAAIICVHNHPSGATDRSRSDDILTRKLFDACKLMDIPLLDHLIITDQKYYSYADDGTIIV